jgi:hypothetical protein
VWIKTNPVSAAIAASSRFVEIDSFQQSRIRRDGRNRRAQGVWTDQFDQHQPITRFDHFEHVAGLGRFRQNHPALLVGNQFHGGMIPLDRVPVKAANLGCPVVIPCG